MLVNACPYCQTEYVGDVDADGKPICGCSESEIERLKVCVADWKAYSDKLAQMLPEGGLPKDLENLRRANELLAQQVHKQEEIIQKMLSVFKLINFGIPWHESKTKAAEMLEEAKAAGFIKRG